jgi:hypothetical protein
MITARSIHIPVHSINFNTKVIPNIHIKFILSKHNILFINNYLDNNNNNNNIKFMHINNSITHIKFMHINNNIILLIMFIIIISNNTHSFLEVFWFGSVHHRPNLVHPRQRPRQRQRQFQRQSRRGSPNWSAQCRWMRP